MIGRGCGCFAASMVAGKGSFSKVMRTWRKLDGLQKLTMGGVLRKLYVVRSAKKMWKPEKVSDKSENLFWINGL